MPCFPLPYPSVPDGCQYNSLVSFPSSSIKSLLIGGGLGVSGPYKFQANFWILSASLFSNPIIDIIYGELNTVSLACNYLGYIVDIMMIP